MNRRSRSAFSRAALTLAVACVGHSSLVLADEAPAVRANQLFNEGKARMAGSDFAAACPLLAEGFALDPATGALLALALCHEREGKLASAHYEYSQAAARSVAEGRKDREQAAREKIAALEPRPRASRSPSQRRTRRPPSASMARRSTPPCSASPPRSMAESTRRSQRPGKKPWSTRIAIGFSADAKTVLVPALEPEPAVAAAAAAERPCSARAGGPCARPDPEGKRGEPDGRLSLSATEWLGLGTIVAGLAGVGASAYFAIEAGRRIR